MFSKTARPYDASAVPPAKRLRRNLVDLYASNELSATRAQELMDDAADVGVEDCQTLRRRNKATNDEQQEELRERFAVEVAERVPLVTHLRSPDPHLESTSESRGGDHCANVGAR